jgi:hypothetical protein
MLRTSVDHGTALDLAGTGPRRPGSLEAAIELALELVHGGRAECQGGLRPQALRPAFPARCGHPQRILAAVDAQPGEALVEIGPGRGALTAAC